MTAAYAPVIISAPPCMNCGPLPPEMWWVVFVPLTIIAASIALAVYWLADEK